MACVSCGSETKVGVLMCKGCLEGILDPLSLLARMGDPAADLRLHQMGSAVIRVGPVASAEVQFGEGAEPALRLRALIDGEERPRLQSLVEEYLAAAGVSLHLWGDERVPRRAFLWRMVEEVEPLDLRTEMWARASVRMGNLHALLVLAASELPVDGEWQNAFIMEHAGAALSLYARAKEYRPLWRVARSNQALLFAWMGRTEDSLGLLEDLQSYRVDRETVQFLLKKVMVLCDAGRDQECREELDRIPEELLDARARRFREQLEARR